MNAVQKIIIGSTISLGVFALSFSLFSSSVANRSLSTIDGTLTVKHLGMPMQIFRDGYGIPHIIAKTEHDMWFGVGYAHAQDRLWQMDFIRRAGRGQLSEIFGKRTLRYDIFLRSLQLAHTAKTIWKSLSPESRTALQAYSQGVNSFLSSQHSLPFEFETLRYTPSEWTPEDCLVVMRMMAWELNLSFWSDAAFGAIAGTIGVERALDLVPSYPDSAPTIIPSDPSGSPNPQDTDQLSARRAVSSSTNIVQHIPSHINGQRNQSMLYVQVMQELTAVRDFLGMGGTAIGSNSWVHTSKDGGAILANDPHLTLTLPARWYQAHLTSPTMNVIGLTLPGLPFVVIGRNDHIAWGITNMMADDCDYFIERLDSTGRLYRKSDSSWQKLRLLRDTIAVADSLPAIIDYRFTERSVLISDMHPFRMGKEVLHDETATAKTEQYFTTTALSFSWTGHYVSDESKGFLLINKAKNFEEFVQGTRFHAVPGLNFTFADNRGNIGIAVAGAIPQRRQSSLPAIFPQQGWEISDQWQGLHSTAELPVLFNPSQKYIVSANNKTAHTLPFYITSLWEPPSRAQRIHELLAQYDGYNAIQALIMQTDLISPSARELMPRIIKALKASAGGMDPKSAEILSLFEAWDYSMDAYQPTPMIYNKLYERIIANTFKDELGETLYRLYTFIGNIPHRKLIELLTDPDKGAYWFDNKTSAATETFDDICRRSFVETREQLTIDFGTDNLSQWQYGTRHGLTLRHPFGAESEGEESSTITNMIVNHPTIPSGGNATTISCSHWEFRQPFTVSIGASTRFVCAMRDTVCYTILPGGSSGQPMSQHYTNQINLWRTGGYIKMPVSGKTPLNAAHTLVLMPAK